MLIIQCKIILIMSQRKSSSSEKSLQIQLAIRRAEFIKKLKIKVKLSDSKLEEDRLILIQTFNTQKNISVELIMRKLSQLDAFIAHMNIQHGGHIIPVFNFDLYFQDSLEMNKLVPAIQEYLNDLKHNKYCRQDLKFYCFIIEQHTSFQKQYTLSHMINNATDASRKYLNQMFTRKTLPSLKNADIMVHAHNELSRTIDQYIQIKQVSLIKSKQTMILEQVACLFAEMSAWPGIAVQPQEFDIDYICKAIISSQKLIEQAKCAFGRWEKLVDNVRELQNNVYKGLHQYEEQFNQRNEQLKNWSESLSQQFYDLTQYLSDKMEAMCGQVYKINKKFIDMAVFAGQSVHIDKNQQVIQQNKEKKKIKSMETVQRKKVTIKQEVRQQNRIDKVEIELRGIKLKEKDSLQIGQDRNEQNLEAVQKYGDIADWIEKQEQKQIEQLEIREQQLKTKQQITCDDE